MEIRSLAGYMTVRTAQATCSLGARQIARGRRRDLVRLATSLIEIHEDGSAVIAQVLRANPALKGQAFRRD
jgi:hypothetical protein